MYRVPELVESTRKAVFQSIEKEELQMWPRSGFTFRNRKMYQ